MALPPTPTEYVPWLQWWRTVGKQYFVADAYGALAWWKANVLPLRDQVLPLPPPPPPPPPPIVVYPDQLWVPLTKDGQAGIGQLRWNGKQFDLVEWKDPSAITPPPFGTTRKYTDYELGGIIGQAVGHNIPYGTSDSHSFYGFPAEILDVMMANIQNYLNISNMKEIAGQYMGGSKMCGDYAYMTLGILRFWFPRSASCYVVGNMVSGWSHAWNVVVDCDAQVWEVDVMYGYKKNICKDKTDRKYVILNR